MWFTTVYLEELTLYLEPASAQANLYQICALDTHYSSSSFPLSACVHKAPCSAPIATAIMWDHISMHSKDTLVYTGLSE